MSADDVLRALFESQARDTWNFKRSRRGTYVNPSVARDWKWFQLGYAAALHPSDPRYKAAKQP